MEYGIMQYKYIYICVCVCIVSNTYVHMHTHTHPNIYIHTHGCVYVYIYTYMYTYIHTYSYIYIHIHTYTYIYTFIRVYIYGLTNSQTPVSLMVKFHSSLEKRRGKKIPNFYLKSRCATPRTSSRNECFSMMCTCALQRPARNSQKSARLAIHMVSFHRKLTFQNFLFSEFLVAYAMLVYIPYVIWHM